jgi:putative ABC transport system permease protein
VNRVRAWFVRFGGLFGKQRRDSELAAELESHVQLHIDENLRARMTPEEARRQALIKLGGIEQTKESYRDRRGLPWLETLVQDVRFSLRMLRKNPGFTLIAIFALALGIGTSTVVFSVFYNLLFNGFAARDASRLVVPLVQPAQLIHLADLDVVREQNQVFENVVGWTSGMVLLSDGHQTYQFYDGIVTSDAFEFYGVPPLLGRGILPDDGKPGAPPVFVMGYKTWKASFNGDPKILGQSYTVDGEPRTLVGIMPPRFQAYGPLQQIWIPITWTPGAPGSDRGPFVFLLARLKPGVSLKAASAELDVIVKRLATLHPDDFPKHFRVQVQSASDALMGPLGLGSLHGTGFDSNLKGLLYDLLAAVTMLLLIACSNVANLLLARTTMRGKEIAVRSALGATRGRMIRQLFVESSTLAVPACVVGCVFAWFGMKVAMAVMPEKGFVGGGVIGGETVIGLNVPVLLFALGITLLTTLICGLTPALHVARGDLQSRLTGNAMNANAHFRHGIVRAGLVTGEVALSIVLLIGAGLMIRSFFLLRHVDLGFDPNKILVAYFGPRGPNQGPDLAKITSPQRRVMLGQVVDRLKNLPGVSGIAIEDTIPGYGPQAGPEVTVPGATHAEMAGFEGCDEDLLPMLELRLIHGKWLSREEVQSAQYVAVINQALAHDFFGDANPIGRQLRVKGFQRPPQPPQDVYFQIVGVIADVKNRGIQQPALPMVFIPHTITGSFFLLLKTTVDPSSLKHAVQEQVWAVDPNEIFWVLDPLKSFLQTLTYAIPEFGLSISAPLAGIALLLVVIGIFSVMAYTVSLQTHEIGIRMALGAQRAGILGMILAKGLRLIAAGIVIGLFASYSLTRFLASQIWGIPVTDTWTFATVVALVVLVGIAACMLPARRAMRVDPMVTLRYE